MAVAFISTLIYVGSIDSESYDDLGLLARLEDVPDDRNGYTAIAYMFEDDFEFYSDRSYLHKLGAYVEGEDWSDEVASELLEGKDSDIEATIAASEYPQFKFETSEKYGGLPHLEPALSLLRLLVLQAIVDARADRLDQAVELTQSAIVFSEQIKAESSHVMILYMFGVSLEHMVLQWVHQLVTQYALSEDQFLNLKAAVDAIPDYKIDSFDKTFAGELRFVQSFLEGEANRPLTERWDIFLSKEYYEEDSLNVRVKWLVSSYLILMSPRYVMHTNEILDVVAKVHKEVSQQSPHYCDSVTLRATDLEPSETWLDILQPNNWGGLNTTVPATFELHFTQRCFAHTYVAAIKAIVALKHYQSREGELPEELAALVPDYLSELPIDPFNGRPLMYSKSDGWLYSVGDNFIDNGGSEDSRFVRYCHRDKQCASNPTVPLVNYTSP